jgi:hypothetical protein
MPNSVSHGRKKRQLIGTDGEAIHSFRNAISVHDADVHNVPFNEHFHRHTGVSTTFAVAASAGDIDIEATSVSGFAIGDDIQLEDGIIETTFPRIIDIIGNVLYLDRQIDNDFEIGDGIEKVTYEMNVTGTVASPISFRVIPDLDQKWHVVSFAISMIHNTAGSDDAFGNISALANGLILRGFNGAAGKYRTLANWKNNADMKLDTRTVNPYTDKAGGTNHGTFITANIKFIAGAVPEFDGATGSFLEVLVQDPLPSLISIRMKAAGHIVGF